MPPQVLLPSSFLEFSSTWWLTFQLNASGCEKHRKIHHANQTKKITPLITRETAFLSISQRAGSWSQYLYSIFGGLNYYCRCLGFWIRRGSLYSSIFFLGNSEIPGPSLPLHESPRTLVQNFIFLPHLRTQRCVLIGFSRYRSPCVLPIKLTGCPEYLRTFRRNWTRHSRRTYRSLRDAANWAEMADDKQMEKIVPLITCEITLCQFVCELVFGVNIFDLNLGVSRVILSHNRSNRSRATLWVLETCLIVGLLPFKWSSWSQLRCLHKCTDGLCPERNVRFKWHNLDSTSDQRLGHMLFGSKDLKVWW